MGRHRVILLWTNCGQCMRTIQDILRGKQCLECVEGFSNKQKRSEMYMFSTFDLFSYDWNYIKITIFMIHRDSDKVYSLLQLAMNSSEARVHCTAGLAGRRSSLIIVYLYFVWHSVLVHG